MKDPCADPYEAEVELDAPEVPPRTSPKPDAWPSSLHRQLESLRFVCPPYYRPSLGPEQRYPDLGCERCPIGTLESETAEGRNASPPSGPAAQPLPSDELRLYLQAVHEGSFTSPGANERIVEFQGCEVRYEGGGSYLLQRNGAGWKVRSYVRGAVGCSLTRLASGRQVQVCSRTHTSGTSQSVRTHVVDWKPVLHGQKPKDELVADFSGEGSPYFAFCDPRDTTVLTGELSGPELVDANGDGVSDIRFTLTYAAVSNERMTTLKSHPDYDRACKCAVDASFPHGRIKPGCQCPQFDFPALATASLVFLAKGEGFVPAPETRSLLLSLEPFSAASEQCSVCSTFAESAGTPP